MQQPSISIAIVDDHTLFRSGLASLLEEFDEIEVMFEAMNGIDLQAKINRHAEVQLILMDINMPEMDGHQTALFLQKNHPEIKVLMLTMYDSELALIRLLKAGVKGLKMR